MNRRQLVEALATHFEGNKKQAAQALDAVLDTITREVARGEKVAIKGFGAFEKAVRPARMVRNPSTGELFQASAKVVMRFRPSAQLRDVISGAAQLPARTLGAAMAAGGAFMGLTEPADATGKSGSDPVRADVAQSVPVKSTTSGTTAEKSTAGTTAKKATTRKATSGTTAKKSTSGTAATKSAAEKTTAKKTTAKKTTAKKTTAKKTTAKKTTAKKTTAKKTTAKKTPSSTTTKKSPTRKTAGRATKKSAAGASADNTPSATSASPG